MLAYMTAGLSNDNINSAISPFINHIYIFDVNKHGQIKDIKRTKFNNSTTTTLDNVTDTIIIQHRLLVGKLSAKPGRGLVCRVATPL